MPEGREILLTPRLSKSSYLNGKQCHLRLWNHYHARHLATPTNEMLQRIFDTGHEVGELACRRYPGGHLVAHDHEHTAEALEETQRLVEANAAPALFEPAFEHRRVFARPDVLERLPDGGWRIVEVKSTVKLHEHFILDVALQLWVLRGAGLDVRDAAVLTLNRGYVHDGVRLDVDALFKLHPVFAKALALQERIGEETAAMQAMLARSQAPDIAPGDHCFAPYRCPFHAHCTRDVVQPDHGIDELPRLSRGRRVELQAAGIEEVKDVTEDFPLNRLQRIVRTAVREGRMQVHGDLRKALAPIKPPVRHLDFETFSLAVPRLAGTRPYAHIPFLFSVHTERDGQPPEHADYLHETADDPRPMLAERLLAAVGEEGSVCVYSRYERRILRALAAAFPQHAAALAALADRLFDLLPVVRNCCYHPDYRGSFSIKNVAPGPGYDDLAIADGSLAAARYQRALAGTDQAQRQQTFADLRAYCQRDTLATLELRKMLAALAQSA